MNFNEWKKETNNGLKKYGYKIRSNLIHYILVFYFIASIITLTFGFIIFYKYLSPYLDLLIENKEVIIEFVNNTMENL